MKLAKGKKGNIYHLCCHPANHWDFFYFISLVQLLKVGVLGFRGDTQIEFDFSRDKILHFFVKKLLISLPNGEAFKHSAKHTVYIFHLQVKIFATGKMSSDTAVPMLVFKKWNKNIFLSLT